MDGISGWIDSRQPWFWWLFAASIVCFIGSLIAVPWIVIQLPPDYFAHRQRVREPAVPPWPRRHPLVHVTLIVLKNAAGVMFVLAGLAMLVLPGQGVLTMVIGLVLLDFPGKYRLERYVVSLPAVLRALNWLRCHSGRKPFDLGP